MNAQYEHRYSASGRVLRASEIRELLKLLNKPEMISFAGGLPNPDAFPVEELKPVLAHVLEEHGPNALQYGPTEGHNKLRDVIARGMGEKYGVTQELQNIIILNGSQQGLSLLSQVFLNPGDTVLTASPTYLGALMAFKTFHPRITGVALDEEGIRVDLLEDKLRYLASRGRLPKLVYLIPTFQNPTGVTHTLQRRKRVYELISEYDVLLVEDDPYGLLRFEGESVPLIKSLDIEERVIYLGSFSKILAPGFRIAWMAAPEEIVNKVTLAKQAADLCTNTFGQYCTFEAMYQNILFPHIEEVIRQYKTKRDIMLQAMDSYFPDEAIWTRPEGGLFIWVKLPEYIDTFTMLPRAIESNVAYVIGKPFFPDGSGKNTLRLNFSYSSDDTIVEGIKRLGTVIKTEIQRHKKSSLEEEIISAF